MAKTEFTFTIDGSVLDFNAPSPLIQKVIAYLDKLPPGEILSRESVAKAVGSTPPSLKSNGLLHKDALEGYLATIRYQGSQKVVYSSRANIALLKKSLEGK